MIEQPEPVYCPICFALVPETPGMACPTPDCPYHGRSVVVGVDADDRQEAVAFWTGRIQNAVLAGLSAQPAPAGMPSRDDLGRQVRMVWLTFCAETNQPVSHSHNSPYEQLSEWEQEVDRRIGESLYRAGRAGADLAPVEQAVVEHRRDYRTHWRDREEGYWLARLVQEFGELAGSLVGNHDDAPEHELTQIASICINWLEMRGTGL